MPNALLLILLFPASSGLALKFSSVFGI
jgi:hypothetical protein